MPSLQQGVREREGPQQDTHRAWRKAAPPGRGTLPARGWASVQSPALPSRCAADSPGRGFYLPSPSEAPPQKPGGEGAGVVIANPVSCLVGFSVSDSPFGEEPSQAVTHTNREETLAPDLVTSPHTSLPRNITLLKLQPAAQLQLEEVAVALSGPTMNGNIVRVRVGTPDTSVGQGLLLSGGPGAGGGGFPCSDLPRFSVSDVFPS